MTAMVLFLYSNRKIKLITPLVPKNKKLVRIY